MNLDSISRDWPAWAKEVRRGQMAAQSRAWAKIGKKPKPLKVTAPTAPKPSQKAKDAVREEKAKPEGVSRSTGVGNPQGFACPVCWGVPTNLRPDGFSIARHLPVGKGKLYRDTEFCDGQGKISVCVMDPNWKPGTEPLRKMSAKKWQQGNGVKP